MKMVGRALVVAIMICAVMGVMLCVGFVSMAKPERGDFLSRKLLVP